MSRKIRRLPRKARLPKAKLSPEGQQASISLMPPRIVKMRSDARAFAGQGPTSSSTKFSVVGHDRCEIAESQHPDHNSSFPDDASTSECGPSPVSIAADFASTAKTIASQQDRSAALEFLRTHAIPNDLGNLAATDLRLWGDLAFTAGMNEEAVNIYLRLILLEPNTYWAFFQMGRLNFQQEDYPGAASMLSKAASLSHNAAGPWYELSRLYFRQRNIAELKKAVIGFAAADREPLTGEQANVLSAIAHFLFERKLRNEPLQLYSLLIDSGVLDSSIQIRYAECLIAANQFNAAVNLLEPLRQTNTIADWGLRSLALAYAGLGKLELAAAILAEIIERNPSNIHYLRFRLRLLCQLGDRDAIARLMQTAHSNLGEKEYQDIRITELVLCADYTALIELLRNNPGYGSAAIERDLMSAISGAVHQKKEFQAAAALAAHFLARFGNNIKVLLNLMSAAFATRNWHLAKLSLATASEQDFRSNLELRLKRFEFYCFTGALDQAQVALKDLEPLSELPKKRLTAVLRYYAEIGDWSALYQLSMETLDAEFNFERSGYLIFRAVRKTGMHMQAKRQIETIGDFDAMPALKRLRSIIIEDMIQNGHMLEDLIGDPHLADLPALHQRLLFKKLVLQRRKKAGAAAKRFAIYYCTNINYLGPTFVSLASLVENNRDLVECSDVFIIADSGSREFAKVISAKVSKKYEVNVQLAEFAGVNVDLKAKYGLFTAGHSLVPAAYFRIFFAKELQRQNRYEGALYINSDTIIRASLYELFESRPPFPLMARLEVPRPEIDMAIAMNDLEPGRYFNSGILFFDLKHPEIGAALDKTIQAVQHSRQTLVYHDQCALNIGFKGQFFPLEAKFNHFVKPEDETPISDGAIIHFLDRPKPWDPAYSGKFCGLWFAHWHKLAIKIGGGEAMKLYNLSNRE